MYIILLDGLWRHAFGGSLRSVIDMIAHGDKQVEKPVILGVSKRSQFHECSDQLTAHFHPSAFPSPLCRSS